jgi:spermidine synthase
MSSSNLEILAYEHTDLGPLCLRRRELLSSPGTVVTEITLNHEFLMSSLHTDSERALARVALELHSGRELDVLVGGLGLGYTAHEALQSSRVARVVAVELLPQVVEWMRTDQLPLSRVLMEEERLSVETADAYARLLAPPTEETFDIILVDIDHAPQDRLGDADDGFYTEEGLRRVRRHLAPGGVLGVWSWAESPPFARALERVFETVHVEPVTFLNQLVDEERTDWLFFGTDRA